LERRRILLALFVATLLGTAGCGKPQKAIVVGSRSDTEQLVVGEIVAQHLERALNRKVERRLGLGGELIAYQALAGGEITLYPDYTGSIETSILKEAASQDPAIVLERTRNELSRLAQLDVLDPLGYENPPVVVVRTADAEKNKIRTLSEAAAGPVEWKLGASYEFRQRIDTLPAVSSYRLRMAQGVRGLEASQLFPALQKGDLSMIVANTTDGHLESPEYRILDDDKHVFPPYQACLLVRHDATVEEPRLRPALAQLAGKFNGEMLRKMDADVELNHRTPADVASEFLAAAGLK
jgi:glycine betaine/choline ABC-type transport system substrate-binding protein